MMMQTMTVLLAMFSATSFAAGVKGGNKGAKPAGDSITYRRRAQEASTFSYEFETAYCNSIGCPGGYIPIQNAWETECDYGICTVKQCCDAFCWGFACTNGIPNYETINEKCPDDEGCTAELCCTTPVLTCSSIGCPNGYIPIPDAHNTPCDDGECTRDQCCDAFCWGHACPNGYIPNYKTVNDECPLSGCTDDLCCVRG